MLKKTLLIFCIMLIAACAAPSTPPPTLPAPQTLTSAPQAIAKWNVGDQGVEWTEIAFDDFAPAGITLQQCWNGMGMDDRGRVYIGFTSKHSSGYEDFVVFRYDPSSGAKKFLGTFVEVAKAAGNLAQGESIPKGHTRLIFADGKMYMGSQSFHDLKWEIDDLPTYRGAHMFAFDTLTDQWQDLAATLPDGVIIPQQGIVAMGIQRDQHTLIGLAHPHSDLIYFDYRANTVTKIVPGIPWRLGNPLSREVIVAPSGRIYTYRGTEDPKQRDEKNPVWVYDPASDTLTNTGFMMTQGFWIGQTETRDGSKIYVSTTNGQLYEFDTASETFTDRGYLLPKKDADAGRKILFMYGVTLSPDETKLYYIPAVIENPQGTGELYSYDLQTGEVKFIQQLLPGIYTSADARDDQHIYLAHFGTYNNLWTDTARLMIIRAESLP